MHIPFSAVAINRQQFIVVLCPFYAETNLLSGSTSSRYIGNDAHAADCVIHISLLHSRTVYIQQPAHQEQQMQTNNAEDFIDLLRYSNKKAVYGSTIVLYFFCATISFL